MVEKKNSKRAATPAKRPKPRKHGYRGYGSTFAKDARASVHWGRGFAGVEPLGTGSESLPKADLLSDDLKEKTSKS